MKKKIWIDLVNSPHVLFFIPIIKQLRNQGNEVFITARSHSHTIDLLNYYGLDYELIGFHRGKKLFNKAIGLVNRVYGLLKYLNGKKFDIIVSHQSAYGSATGFLKGIKKRIFIFDNETAHIQNLIGMTFATDLLAPKYLNLDRIFFKKIKKYNSLKESVYLNRAKIGKKEDIGLKREYILIRPEPWTAAYYNSNDGDRLINLIKEISRDEIGQKYDLVIIPRDKNQKEIYKKEVGNLVIIPEKALDGPTLVKNASLLIGAGGTMNREAVVLGTPVISIYSGHPLDVDSYLINNGFIKHNINVSLEDVKNTLAQTRPKKDFLEEGILAQKQIIEEITT